MAFRNFKNQILWVKEALTLAKPPYKLHFGKLFTILKGRATRCPYANFVSGFARVF